MKKTPLFAWSLFFFLGLTLLARPILAVDLEQEAKKIEAKLVAPCCWTYPVAEHHSEAAMSIKSEIRERLKNGETEAEILAFFEKRFGERILTTPTTRGFNVMIWIFPFVIFLLGSALVYLALRFFGRKKTPTKQTEDIPLESSEQDASYRKRLDEELYRAED